MQSLPFTLSAPAVLTRKVRSFCGNYLCILAIPSSTKQQHLSPFFLSSSLKGSGVLPAIQGKAWIWFYSLSRMLRLLPLISLMSFIFNFFFFAGPFSSTCTCSSNFYPKNKSANRSKLASPFTRFHLLLPSNFSTPQLIQTLHSCGYLQPPRFSHSSAQ